MTIHAPFRTLSLALLAVGAASLLAQTAPKAPAAAHHTAAATTTAAHKPAAGALTASACATDLPELSPKLPALPAGSPCPKALFTITTEPQAKLSYMSPLAGADIRETLGLESTAISEYYVDTKIGSGPLAAPGKFYSIHYTGYLTDGTKFDSSLDRGEPITIKYGGHQVIPGWDTGFGGMHIGGKRRLYIPFQLAYGANGRPPQIPAKAELIFDVELVSQSDTAPAPKPAPAPAAKPATTPAAAPQTTPSSAAEPTKPAPAPAEAK